MYTKNAHYLYTHNIYCVYPIYMHEISSSPALLGNFWESAKVKAASRLECVLLLQFAAQPQGGWSLEAALTAAFLRLAKP